MLPLLLVQGLHLLQKFLVFHYPPEQKEERFKFENHPAMHTVGVLTFGPSGPSGPGSPV